MVVGESCRRKCARCCGNRLVEQGVAGSCVTKLSEEFCQVQWRQVSVARSSQYWRMELSGNKVAVTSTASS